MRVNLNKLLPHLGKFHLLSPHGNFLNNAYSLFPKKVELQALVKYYDVDGDGNISYEEFLRGLR